MTDNKQMIAEARHWLETHPNTHSARKLDVKRLAAALEAAEAKLDAVKKWRHDWLEPPRSESYPHTPRHFVRRLDDVLTREEPL